MNVADRLSAVAARRPDDDAIRSFRTGERLSFRGLDERSSAIAKGLTEMGVQPGERVLLLVRPGVELIALAYALFKHGALPVLIDPGMGRDAFLRCVASLRPTTLIGIPLAHVARLLKPAPFASVERAVTVGTRWLWGGETLARLQATPGPYTRFEATPDTPAAILFTSGSTGPAKGVVYTHGNFDAQVDALRDTYGFADGEVDVAAFPLFSLFDAALGMTSVIPDMDAANPAKAEPAKIAAAIRESGATTCFGSPVIWRKAAPWFVEHGVRFPGLKRIMIAGASVPPALLETLLQAVPDGDVGTPYGATESLPVACVWGRDIVAHHAARTREGAGVCVGRPAVGIDVRVIRIDDGPIATWSDELELPRGEIGELVVRGKVVTRLYAELPEATAKAKIADGPDVWHRMGDLGHVDAEGNLWYCGRKAERVGTLYTECVEGRFNGSPGVPRCALVDPDGRPTLVVEGPPDQGAEARILASGLVEAVRFQPKLPVDPRHNSKIHRHQLRDALAAPRA